MSRAQLQHRRIMIQCSKDNQGTQVFVLLIPFILIHTTRYSQVIWLSRAFLAKTTFKSVNLEPRNF
jgi:hypothetical protein